MNIVCLARKVANLCQPTVTSGHGPKPVLLKKTMVSRRFCLKSLVALGGLRVKEANGDIFIDWNSFPEAPSSSLSPRAWAPKLPLVDRWQGRPAANLSSYIYLYIYIYQVV